jgi:hypothetical protein
MTIVKDKCSHTELNDQSAVQGPVPKVSEKLKERESMGMPAKRSRHTRTRGAALSKK